MSCLLQGRWVAAYKNRNGLNGAEELIVPHMLLLLVLVCSFLFTFMRRSQIICLSWCYYSIFTKHNKKWLHISILSPFFHFVFFSSVHKQYFFCFFVFFCNTTNQLFSFLTKPRNARAICMIEFFFFFELKQQKT